MKRIDTATAVAGLFVDGDPGVPTLATRFNASWCNNVQEELAAAIEAAGLTLDGGDTDQLQEAIRVLAFQTSAARQLTTGDDLDVDAVTPGIYRFDANVANRPDVPSDCTGILTTRKYGTVLVQEVVVTSASLAVYVGAKRRRVSTDGGTSWTSWTGRVVELFAVLSSNSAATAPAGVDIGAPSIGTTVVYKGGSAFGTSSSWQVRNNATGCYYVKAPDGYNFDEHLIVLEVHTGSQSGGWPTTLVNFNRHATNFDELLVSGRDSSHALANTGFCLVIGIVR